MKQFFALVAFALIAGCGFKPVYATGAGATYGGAITVEPIDGRSGYILRRALQEELAIGLPNVTEAASLQMKLGTTNVRTMWWVTIIALKTTSERQQT